jgi:hypothetical protein
MAVQINTIAKKYSHCDKPKLYKLLFCLLLLSSFPAKMLFGQNDLIVQDVIVGKADVSAPGSVTLRPGFQAKEGCNFHAFIGALQGQYSSTTITPPSSNTTPVSGSSGTNYIKTITYREIKSTIPTVSFKHSEEIQYFDGLGRPVQSIQVGASPGGNDIIQPVLYDSFGREAVKTLSYTASRTGLFRTNVTESTVNAFYSPTPPAGIVADTRAYNQTVFDNSPFNRIISQTGPGSDWATNNKSVGFNYFTNPTTETGWKVTGDYSYSQVNYAINTLYITETTDEDGNLTREYKDNLDHVVFKKSLLGGT